MNQSTPEVLFFTKAGCPACRRMAPAVRSTAERFGAGVRLVELDTATNPEEIAEHRIRAVPTLVAVNGHRVIARSVGELSEAAISELFAGAVSGSVLRLPLSPIERMMRLSAAIGVGLIGYAAAQPLVLILAIGLGIFAFWDLIPSRRSRVANGSGH